MISDSLNNSAIALSINWINRMKRIVRRRKKKNEKKEYCIGDASKELFEILYFYYCWRCSKTSRRINLSLCLQYNEYVLLNFVLLIYRRNYNSFFVKQIAKHPIQVLLQIKVEYALIGKSSYCNLLFVQLNCFKISDSLNDSAVALRWNIDF